MLRLAPSVLLSVLHIRPEFHNMMSTGCGCVQKGDNKSSVQSHDTSQLGDVVTALITTIILWSPVHNPTLHLENCDRTASSKVYHIHLIETA